MIHLSYRPLAAAAILTTLLAACSSGGTVTPAGPAQTQPLPPAATTTSFVISLNGGGGETVASSPRRPAFVSPSTRSITFAVDGGAATTQNLTASSTNCAASNGGVRCTVPLSNVAAGTHALSLTAWDAANGTGTKLGANTNIAFTVVANTANVVNGVIGAIPASFVIIPGQGGTGNMTLGYTMDISARPQLFSVNVLDADGNTIVGPGAPAIAMTPGSGSVSIVPGGSPNAFAVSVANPSGYPPGPPYDFGSTGLRLTATPQAGTGTSSISTAVHLYGIATYVYIVNANGQVQAFDDSGAPLALPGASTTVNTTGGNIAIAYDPASSSLLAIQGTNVVTYDFSGSNYLGQLTEAGTALGSAFAWDPRGGVAYGFDMTSRRLARLDTGITPTTVTPIGPVYSPVNPFVALLDYSINPASGNADTLIAATNGSVFQLLLDGTEAFALPPAAVGTNTGLAYDPATANLWVAGSTGLAVYPGGALSSPPTAVADANGPIGVAIGSRNGLVYVADGTGHVQVFDEHGVPQFSFATAAGTHPVQIVIAP